MQDDSQGRQTSVVPTKIDFPMFQSSIKNSIVSQVVSSLQICKWHATHDPVKSSLQHEKTIGITKKAFAVLLKD